MIKITKLKITFIYLAIIFLAVLYIFSFTVFSTDGQKKAFSQQIVFLHEAEIADIDGFIIHTPDSELIISKSNNMWLLADTQNPDNKIPADVQKLKSLFLSLATTRTISKAGDKTNPGSYGLDSNNSSSIMIFKNGSLYHSLDFGELDFSQTHRYFTDEELNSVFYSDTSFDIYLTASVQSWSDPYIISTQIKDSVFNTGDILSASSYDYKEKRGTALTSQSENWASKISKLEELRHGGLAQINSSVESLENYSELLTKVHLETGNLCQIEIDIFATDTDEEYTVRVKFYSELTQNEFSYCTAISLWTYNKIKEIML